MTDEDIINAVLEREGGYVDHPADSGGPTNYGITLGTLTEWRDKVSTAEDVRALTETEARAIYKSRYIEGPGFDKVADASLRGLLVDCAINHGPFRGVRMLQTGLGVTPDGILGPVTLAETMKWDPKKLYLKVLAERIRYYGKIVTHDPSQAVFAAGWANRAAEFLDALTT